MHSTKRSRLKISGFDNSTQLGAKHGTANMYFMQTDPSAPSLSTGQGVSYTFDTVDNLNSNLFAVSDYYEQGMDVFMQHNGFSGVKGLDPKTGKPFEIPCVYSPEHKGWLVHFVIAKTKEDAELYGKALQKSLQNNNPNAWNSLHNSTLNDNQLLAAAAISRGDIAIRNGDEYFDMNLGKWSDPDNSECRLALSNVLNCDSEITNRITWAFPASTNDEPISENDNLQL